MHVESRGTDLQGRKRCLRREWSYGHGGGGGGGVLNWEVEIDVHTRPRVKERASEDLPCMRRAQLLLGDHPAAWDGEGGEEGQGGGDVYVSLELIPLLTQQNPTQHCKAASENK